MESSGESSEGSSGESSGESSEGSDNKQIRLVFNNKNKEGNNMVRVTYTYDQETNTFISKDVLGGTTLFYAVLHPDNLEFKILGVNNNGLIAKGTARTLSELKTSAKKALIDLGVQFGSEIRNRG